MADAILVRLDMEALARRLGRDRVYAWLEENDFIRTDYRDAWICEEVSLALLQRDEVMATKPYA